MEFPDVKCKQTDGREDDDDAMKEIWDSLVNYFLSAFFQQYSQRAPLWPNDCVQILFRWMEITNDGNNYHPRKIVCL